jgi:hypothetical protein
MIKLLPLRKAGFEILVNLTFGVDFTKISISPKKIIQTPF